LTHDYNIYVGVDDSETKLSMELFVVIFIFWAAGMVLAMSTMLFEKWVYKRIAKKKEMERLARRRPMVAR